MERGSLLQESEREYLDAYHCYPGRRLHGGTDRENIPVQGEKQYDPDIDEAKAKYRIKNEVGKQFHDNIQRFNHDLRAFENFYTNLSPDGRYKFHEFILPTAVDELKRLRDHVDQLIERAESDRYGELRGSVSTALTPLLADLEEYRAYAETGPTEFDNVVFEDGDIIEPHQLAAEKKEHDRRCEILAELLADDGLLEIFEWIAEHEGENVPNRTKQDSGYTWTQAIGKHLRAETESGNGLVEKTAWGFELTTRGTQVYEGYCQLASSEPVQQYTGDQFEDNEVALAYLRKFFGRFS